MIITRTPFRVTLGGGGTDLPSYYEKHEGFIFSMALNKFMYVFLNRPTVDNWIRLHYSDSEQVEHVSELKHELAREGLKRHGIESKIEISSLADIPAGTGIGSSSCYLIGLLNAIHAYKRNYVSLQALAEEACDIELNTLKKGIGKQDQYMAAFGGLTSLDIAKDGSVKVNQMSLNESAIANFVANTHIYYTGIRRSALDVLVDQDQAMKDRTKPENKVVEESLHQIKNLGYQIKEAIQKEDFDTWGTLLHKHWTHKKKMSNKISVSKVDALYDEVRKNYNVLGGKIIGAGGGGFIMLYCNKNHKALEKYMQNAGMARLHYQPCPVGTSIMSNFNFSHS